MLSALKAGFRSSTGTMLTGTIVGQGVVVAATPIITRLYTPEQLGILAVFVAIASMLGIVSTMRYELAIALPRTDDEAIRVAIAAILGSAFLTAGATVLVLAFPANLIRLFDAPELQVVLWVLPFAVAGTGIYKVGNYWAIRRHDFPAIARSKVSQGLAHAGIQLGAGFLGGGPVGLAIGHSAGRTVGAYGLLRRIWQRDRMLMRDIRFREVGAVAYRYRHFPIVSSWSAMMNTGSTSLPPLLLTALYSASTAGLYGVAERSMLFPVAVIGEAVRNIYVGDASTAIRADPGGLRSVLLARVRKLALVGLLPCFGIGFFAPDAFAFIFGAGWREAGIYVRMLIPVVFLQFTIVPVSQTLYLLQRQWVQLAWDVARVVSVAGSLAIPSMLGLPVRTAIVSYSVTLSVWYVTFLGYCVYAAGHVHPRDT